MTPKEMADWLHTNMPWYRDHEPEMGQIIAFLRSLPEPTTDARRKHLATWLADGCAYHGVASDTANEIAALLLHPPRVGAAPGRRPTLERRRRGV